MFSKSQALFAILALPFVLAHPYVKRDSGPGCNSSTGSIMCCNAYQSPSEAAQDSETVKQLNALGVDVSKLDAGVGQGCSPPVVGITGAPFCSNNQLCCSGVAGILVLGCASL